MTGRRGRPRRREKRIFELGQFESDEEEPANTAFPLVISPYQRRYVNLSNSQVLLSPSCIDPIFFTPFNPPVNFNDILLIIRPFDEEIDFCGVCYNSLEIPVMTNCGHFFCFNCLNMAMLLKKNYGDRLVCPICRTSMGFNEFSIVVWRNLRQPVVNEEIRMNLFQRLRNTCLTTPVVDKSRNLNILYDEIYMQSPGAWFVRNGPEDSGYDSALDCNYILTCSADPYNIRAFFDEVLQFVKKNYIREDNISLEFDSLSFISDFINQILYLLRPSDTPTVTELRVTRKKLPFYRFYQVPGAHNFFLHPKNYKFILKQLMSRDMSIRKHGSSITGKIVKLITMKANVETLNKYNFLVHLPLNSQFTLCIIDLKQPDIPVEPPINIEDEGSESSSSDDSADYYYKSFKKMNSQPSIDEPSLRNLTYYSDSIDS